MSLAAEHVCLFFPSPWEIMTQHYLYLMYLHFKNTPWPISYSTFRFMIVSVHIYAHTSYSKTKIATVGSLVHLCNWPISVCVCVFEREWMCAFVCVWVWERECVCVCMHVCMFVRECVCVCFSLISSLLHFQRVSNRCQLWVQSCAQRNTFTSGSQEKRHTS